MAQLEANLVSTLGLANALLQREVARPGVVEIRGSLDLALGAGGAPDALFRGMLPEAPAVSGGLPALTGSTHDQAALDAAPNDDEEA